MSTVLWIVIVLFAIAVLASSGEKRTGSYGKPKRIDHSHCFEEDDHECSICGERFRKKGMTCPKCGAKYAGTKEDDGEFVEEMELWDGDEEYSHLCGIVQQKNERNKKFAAS